MHGYQVHLLRKWVNLVKSRDPVRTVRKANFFSLALATVLFFFINVAYIAAVPIEDIRPSGQLIAALFFRRVFGATFDSKVFPLMVAALEIL